MNNKTTKIITGILILIALLCIGIFLFTGPTSQIIKDLFNQNISKEQIADEFAEIGWKGWLLIGILALLQMLLPFMPAEPVQVVAGITYGFAKGVLICTVSVAIGCTIIYFLYKIYGQKLADYFHANLSLDFEKAKHSKRILFFIFIMFFLPTIPYGLICFFAATVGMKYGRYLIGTIIGAIPSVMIGVGLGKMTTTYSWVVSVTVFAILIAILVLLIVHKEKIFAYINTHIIGEYTSATKVRLKHSPLGYIFFYTLTFHYGLRIKMKVVNNAGKITRPSLALCTHGSFIDFYYATRALRKAKPHFMAGRLYFFDRTTGNLLRHCGCFPKSMFCADTECVKNSFRLLKANQMLALMPEARLSTVGKMETVQDTTFKFIKKCGVDVYTVRLNGSYLADPKWGKLRKGGLFRRPLVEVVIDKLITKEELSTLTEQEIATKVVGKMDYNELDWLQQHPEIKYTNKNLAEGLENILYRCPKCGKEFTLSTSGKTISCSCGYHETMDNRYQFVDGQLENFQKWYDWQVQQTAKEVDKDYVMVSNVTLHHKSDNGQGQTKPVGSGVCKMDITGVTYTGTENGEQITKFFPMKTLFCLLFGAGEDFEIYEEKDIWYFVPEDKRTCVKWYVVSLLLKQISEKLEQ